VQLGACGGSHRRPVSPSAATGHGDGHPNLALLRGTGQGAGSRCLALPGSRVPLRQDGGRGTLGAKQGSECYEMHAHPPFPCSASPRRRLLFTKPSTGLVRGNSNGAAAHHDNQYGRRHGPGTHDYRYRRRDGHGDNSASTSGSRNGAAPSYSAANRTSSPTAPSAGGPRLPMRELHGRSLRDAMQGRSLELEHRTGHVLRARRRSPVTSQ
jgi:hypothetical protein